MLDSPPAIAARLKAPLLAAGAVFAAWLLVQALVFRSGAYWWVAEPDSNAGAVTHAIATLQQAARPGRRIALVFGDSRVSEGVSGPRASAGGDFDFINVSVPGSTPRTWYYLLREIERRGLRYDAVVIGTLYVPTDGLRSADWPLDAVHQVALVGLRDVLDYPREPQSRDARRRAWHALLLPELVAQADLRALLSAPLQRWRNLRRRAQYVQDTVDYAGHDERMPAFALVEAAGAARAAEVTPAQRAAYDEARRLHELPVPAELARENAAYLAHWIERIGAQAARHGAPVVAFPLPRGPYRELLPTFATPAWRGVTALPADTFAALEDPAYFFDRLHVNRAGRERMSDTLGPRVRAAIAGAR